MLAFWHEYCLPCVENFVWKSQSLRNNNEATFFPTQKNLCQYVIYHDDGPFTSPCIEEGGGGVKFENFNYLNVAFISYKLTTWDLMLFSGCHTRGQRLRKKDRSC